jgi:glycosyltransferase involved in cell wall biosynthesis
MDGVPTGDGELSRWTALQQETGGDFSLARDLAARLPAVASVYLETAPAARLARRLALGDELPNAFRAEFGDSQLRVVHFTPLDVHDDPGLRVVQLVTSIQQGGAERVALGLVDELGRHGIRSLLVTLGRPGRAAFASPEGRVDLSRLRGDRQARTEAVAREALQFAADLIHGHLLDGEDMARLAALGLPLVHTIHNMRPGWPDSLAEVTARDAALLVACARAVESDLRNARVPIPVRTVWNGVDFASLERTPALALAARQFRQQLGFGPEDLVLLALANPRPQKRLHLLPAILAATRTALTRSGIRREARLVLAGEPSSIGEAGARSAAQVHAEVARLGLADHVRWTGPVDPVAPLLAAADVLVSTSAYEGLSLAQLEALAAGLPVVVTDLGGTAEMARANPAVVLLPADAGPESSANALVKLARHPPQGGREAAAVHFTRARTAERYGWLYPRAIEATRGRRRGCGLWLVTNNLSTGGAQSSARRLLLSLAEQGVRVRAVVLQEQPEYPTPGRRALTSAGVPVAALPPPGTIAPAEAVALLLEQIDQDPPEVVLLWNALAEYKILLADGLLDIPLYDVSPGEMYYASLERYFAKPRPGLPYETAVDYGARLAGVVVKYRGEAERAAKVLQTAFHVIPNGVSTEATPPRARPPGQCVVMGTAARIHPQKKLEELLEALRRAQGLLPPHVLRIAGGVERDCEAYATQLRAQAQGLPVEWVGELEDARPFLEELDFFVLVAEPAGCPNASLEAMAARLAVVITDVGGAAEQVVDGVTGRVVLRGQAGPLAEALVELARNPVERAQWGAAGRARAAEHFSLPRMVADYCRVCAVSGGKGAEILTDQ